MRITDMRGEKKNYHNMHKINETHTEKCTAATFFFALYKIPLDIIVL